MSVNTVPEVEETAPVPEHPTRNRLLAMPLLSCMRIVAERIPPWNVLGKMLAA
jgi:hypothetical protein